MHLIITGDSHANPLATGVANYAKASRGSDLKVTGRPLGSQRFLCEPFFQEHPGHIEITRPEVAKYAAAVPFPGAEKDAIYVFSIGFHTAHFFWTMKGFAPLATHSNEQWVVSNAVFDAVIESKQQYVMAFVEAMQRAKIKFMIVEAPRIFADSSYCKDFKLNNVKYADWRVRETFSTFLTAKGIEHIRVPEHMIDTDGFMHPRYRHANPEDQHHASPLMGYELTASILLAADEIERRR